MLACVLNSISMMCSCVMVVVVVFLPAATYIGRYHIMALVILGAAALGYTFCFYEGNLLINLLMSIRFRILLLDNLIFTFLSLDTLSLYKCLLMVV